MKRIRQLRDEFDRSGNVTITSEYTPHDVGAVLKEYFRDLPDSLLTRVLYPAFLATTKFVGERRLEVLRFLIALLPVVNRDTLYLLLNFLHTVTLHSNDRLDEYGKVLQGNKMDSHNLARLFGPNILHQSKNTEFAVENEGAKTACADIIEVTETLIDNYSTLFEVIMTYYQKCFNYSIILYRFFRYRKRNTMKFSNFLWIITRMLLTFSL